MGVGVGFMKVKSEAQQKNVAEQKGSLKNGRKALMRIHLMGTGI